jgi:hypothetical protein
VRYDTIPKFSTWQTDSAALSSQGKVSALKNKFSNPGSVVAAPVATRPPDLAPIDDLIKLYEKAWSTTAKRTLTADLFREINAWVRAHPGRLPMAVEALKEVVDRHHRVMGLAQRYSNVILAGWAIGCNYNAATGVMSRNMVKNPDYFRHSSSDETDMTRKCGEMVTAISAAQNFIGTQGLTDNPQTLKVFMAPEFFFRGENGAYSPDIVAKIVPLMQTRLGRGWKDWLFVFGTAVAAIENEVSYCMYCGEGNSRITFEKSTVDRTKTVPKCANEAPGGMAHPVRVMSAGADVQNVALISYEGETHLVAKEYVSNIDYKRDEVTIHPGTPKQDTVDVLKLDKPMYIPDRVRSYLSPVHNDERLGGCVFNLAGLTIAIEVCLDHAAPGRALPYEDIVQLLLIPSFGMSIGTGLYCRQNGVVFQIDGRGQGRSHVAIKDGGVTNPRKVHTSVLGARGNIELWGPYPLP